jgi:8-oxo-dGTP pyrophosphatase MutT (NUDIX family)
VPDDDDPDRGPTDPGDELVDVLDDDGCVTEVVSRRRMRAERLRHPAVFIVVRHPDGRILIHRRSATKDLWPGWWDLAIGGVLASGEDPETGARRELAEEIGVDDPGPLRRLRGGAYIDDAVSLVGHCFEVVHPGPHTARDGEVAEMRWATVAELDELALTVRFLPDSWALLRSQLDDR